MFEVNVLKKSFLFAPAIAFTLFSSWSFARPSLDPCERRLELIALRDARSLFLSEQIKLVRLGIFKKSRSIGDVFTFSGWHDTYRIVEYIGGGGEGFVYTVESLKSGEKFAVKEFITEMKLKMNLLELKGLQVPTPKIIATESNRVLFEYIEGFPIGRLELMNSGLPDSIRESLKARFREEATTHDFGRYNSINVIYDIVGDRFVTVDPR